MYPRIILLILLPLIGFSQSPQKINFQSILRNTNGEVIANKAVSLKISILSESINGISVYSETQAKTSDASGLISLQIGNGTTLSGVFSNINWGNIAHFIKLEADFSGGSNYGLLGTQELMSVPYALYASKTGDIPKGDLQGNILYWSGSKWINLNPGQNGQVLVIQNGVSVWKNSTNLSISTIPISKVSQNLMYVSGHVEAKLEDIERKGFVYSTSPNPTILDSELYLGFGSGFFSGQIENLQPNRTYYIRSFATTASGTVYGNEVSKKTEESCGFTISDIDGNTYNTIQIGYQCWMRSNLRVSRYRNGDLIQNNLDDLNWSNTISGSFAIYSGDATNEVIHGKLYNWFSIADSRNICPIGWDIPSDVDLTILVDVFGGSTDAGGKLKDIGTTVWNAPNLAATNESGFSMLPSGIRLTAGNYENIKNNGYLWSKSEYDVNYSWFRGFSRSDVIVSRALANKRSALSIRCIRN